MIQVLKRLIADSQKHADAKQKLEEEAKQRHRERVAEDKRLDSLFGPMRQKQQELEELLRLEKVT
jgi:hypothetical protein